MRNAILTISSAAKTATSGKFGAVLKSTLFAVLLAAASMAGAVPIPGTPVPITLQTFVVMLAALMLPWKQAGAAVLMYLAAGAAGLPVFAGGASTMDEQMCAQTPGPSIPGMAMSRMTRSYDRSASRSRAAGPSSASVTS